MDHECIVIGAGPAAQQAGLFLGRAKIGTVLIGNYEKSDLAFGRVIENLFGNPEAYSGLLLLTDGIKHLARFGVKTLGEEVVDIRTEGEGFVITTSELKTFTAGAVIIATGSFTPTAGIRGERDFLGKGVHTCTACDGPFFKGKTVAVVGTTAHAAQEAVELTDYASSVTLYSQGQDWEIPEPLLARLKERRVALEEKRIVAVEGGAKVEKAVLADQRPLPIDGIFVAVGSAGAVTFANKLGLVMEDGYIRIDRDGKTNLPGIWAAGGVTGGNHQIAKSAGEGCNAAISVIKTLKGLASYVDQT